MTLTQEALDFIKAYEPDLPLCGGIGAEIWRPAGLTPLTAEEVAEVVAFVFSRPANPALNTVVLRPVGQEFP